MKIRIKNYESRIKLSKLLFLPLFVILTALFLPYPTHAAFNIGDLFGFGQFNNLGQLVSKLVMPIFSIASTLVILYFLWGAFKILQSGGNKEEIAGGRQMIIHAIIGFIVLMFAFLILQFLMSSLFGISNFQLF